MARGLQEGEIRQELRSGGHLRNVLIITKTIEGSAEHLAYVRPSWRREFLPLRTWGDRWAVDEKPVSFAHSCGHELDTSLVCRHCGAEAPHRVSLQVNTPGWDVRGPDPASD